MLKRFIQYSLSKFGLELRRSPDPQIPFLHRFEVDGDPTSFWIANTHARDWWGEPVLDFNTEFQELKRMCDQGSTVLEIGAHHGMMTLLLSKCAGDSGRVHAVEASSDNAMVLDANCFQNRVSNISTHFLAIGNEDSVVNFGGESLAAASGVKRQVNLRSLDSFCSEQGIVKVDLLKIDVEGYELDVLKGGENILGRCTPKIALELHIDLLPSAGASAESVWTFIEDCGLLRNRPISMLARPDWNNLTQVKSFSDLPDSGVVNLFIG